MLKKLVKFGNSNALIFDKAILELLNIEEGSHLKIATDGKSLIITPQTPATKETISPTLTYADAIQNSAYEQIIKQYKSLTDEQRASLCKELKSLHEKRLEIAKNLDKNGPEYHAFEKAKHGLLAKYGSAISSEFEKEYIVLRDALVPQLSEIDNKILNFEQKHGLNPEEAIISPSFLPRSSVESGNLQKLRDAYADLFKKHENTRKKFADLQNNTEYIHEMQLMVEKFDGKPDLQSPEYLQEDQRIRYKFVPEARIMDEEMVQIAKKILCGPESKLPFCDTHK